MSTDIMFRTTRNFLNIWIIFDFSKIFLYSFWKLAIIARAFQIYVCDQGFIFREEVLLCAYSKFRFTLCVFEFEVLDFIAGDTRPISYWRFYPAKFKICNRCHIIETEWTDILPQSQFQITFNLGWGGVWY